MKLLVQVLGVVGGLLGIGEDLLREIFLFTFTRDLLSSAVRLGLLGPMQAVSLQRELQPLCEQLATAKGCSTLENASQTEPLVSHTRTQLPVPCRAGAATAAACALLLPPPPPPATDKVLTA